MQKKCLIICSGSIGNTDNYKEVIESCSFVICADGGALYAKNLGIKPHVIVGDFDSLSDQVLESYKNQGVEIQQFPVEKDMTDTELACSIAVKKGFKEIVIIGGTGTRLDHTMTNIFLLKRLLDKGIKASILNEHNEIGITRDEACFNKREGWYLSLLPLTETVEGVTIYGFYYPLNNATLEMGSSWGVSNRLVEPVGRVTLKSGILLTVLSRD